MQNGRFLSKIALQNHLLLNALQMTIMCRRYVLVITELIGMYENALICHINLYSIHVCKCFTKTKSVYSDLQ